MNMSMKKVGIKNKIQRKLSNIMSAALVNKGQTMKDSSQSDNKSLDKL